MQAELNLHPLSDAEAPAQIAALVDGIETEMRHCDLWRQVSPSDTALRSVLPFCADTMQFEQWLQWIFVPRMRAVLRNNKPLPTCSAIAPMAEECLAHHGIRIISLLRVLARFDQKISYRGLQLH